MVAMKPLINKVRPTSGFAHAMHVVLLSILPIIVLILVQRDFSTLALVLILLSKWRMLAVKPRFWAANIRANSVDIIVGLSVLAFMTETTSLAWQVVWTVLYIGWLTALKPSSQTIMIALQALTGFLAGLTALFLLGDDAPAVVLVLGGGVICYLSAHHFFDAFGEAYTKLLSYIWGFFGAALIWVLSHWLLYYPVNGVIAQPTILLVVIGLALAGLYYLDHIERLSSLLRKQIMFACMAITAIVLLLSDWGDKIL